MTGMGWLWLWPICSFMAAAILTVLKGKAGAAGAPGPEARGAARKSRLTTR